jgi:hypothetical protein
MHIFKLISLNTRLNTAGSHRPAMPNYRFTTNDDISVQQKEIIRYNLCVVRHLKRLISGRKGEEYYAVAE